MNVLFYMFYNWMFYFTCFTIEYFILHVLQLNILFYMFYSADIIIRATSLFIKKCVKSMSKDFPCPFAFILVLHTCSLIVWYDWKYLITKHILHIVHWIHVIGISVLSYTNKWKNCNTHFLDTLINKKLKIIDILYYCLVVDR